MKDKVIFYINSANRLSGTDGNFTYYLPLDTNLVYDRVVVLAANIGKTYYQVQAGFNTFTLIEGNQQALITIPPGTYTRDSFASSVKSLLSTLSPNHYTYEISFPNPRTQAETGKFTFTVTGAPLNSQPAFAFVESTFSTIYEQMGFPPDNVYFFVNNTLTSQSVCNFASETCLFLHSDICYNPLTQDNVLQEIYTNGVPYNSYINFTNYRPKEYSKPVMKRSQVYSFVLTDENGTPLNLNGVNMNFTIMLWKSNRFEALVERYIRYKVNKSPLENEEE